jgi:hypothetical protein
MSEIGVSVVVLAFGLGVWYGADEIFAPVVVDPVGPALWPRLLGIGIALLAALHIVVTLLGRRSAEVPPEVAAEPAEKAENEEEGRFSLFRFCGVIALLALYFIGLEELGYNVATPIFTLCVLLLLGVRSIKGLLIPTILLVVLWNALFQYGLGVPLPKGILF